ncbi:MAG: type II secretion system ATPase GspE [Hyphomonadaceae bacterium]|nr:type II secretion system ATPase GspE [Hyphomonadaceae bacterium]MBC6412840.1 type II secretion system ATPase GspE [Hyphomonadaceae bacterium]
MSDTDTITLPRLSYSFARKFGLVAFEHAGEAVLARRPGVPLSALLEARRVIDRPVTCRDIDGSEFESLMAQVYANADLSQTAETALGGDDDLSTLADNLPHSSDLLDSDDDAPVIKLINGILQEAIKMRASDIHIESYEKRLAIRFRIDGALRDTLMLSARLSPVLVSRVKVMAQLDIAKKRVPQDGRFSLNLGERAVDVRVSTLPSQHGERVVMRILEKTSSLLNLSDLGMDTGELAAFENSLKCPNGIILVTGPTGSGKTTTLYASLTGLNNGSRNILTVEDPVEYALDGIGQTQVNNRVGMSFAAGLRAILRQDPDVVMVGEIRDPETAEIAVQASLTGHLVLSTVHTNSAIAAITRLRDMGVEPFLLASTVTSIVAQRLVRRLCPHCREPYTLTAGECEELGLSQPDTPVFRSKGCQICHHIGYTGRLGLYEIVVMDDTLRAMIHDGAREIDMAAHAFIHRDTLLQSGASHVLAGNTSVEEVLRVCRTGAGEGG